MGVTLTFEDANSVVADGVDGCDGIRSKVKEFLIPDEIEQNLPQYSSMYGCRVALHMETMMEAVENDRARLSTMHIGDGAYAIPYPIMRAQKANVGLHTLDDRSMGL